MNYRFNCDDCKNFKNDDTCYYCDCSCMKDCKCERGCVNFSPYEDAIFKDTVYCENFEDRVLSIPDKQ